MKILPVGKLTSIPTNNVTSVPIVLKYRYESEYQLSISGVLKDTKSVIIIVRHVPNSNECVYQLS